ncbi:MAG: hypothetical protein KDD32_04390 [Bacteroidetes bacterium]|nr:hypothetical protein [Bacteroidota bacterium]
MNEQEHEKVKLNILKKIKRTKADISYLNELTQPIAPENSLGRLTRMDAINNKSVNEATLRQAKSKLGQLEYALQRIEQKDKTFGQCSNCQDTIPLPRILLMPESDKCVKCAK